ncbi:MAG: FAD-binding protein, partial [bacterium]
MGSYNERAEEFAQSLSAAPSRLSKSTSNLFRNRSRVGRNLKTESLTNVIEVNTEHGWADIEAMTPYDKLVDVTLNHSVLPCVVPQLKSITIGGAASGIGIESSSFRYGLVHESMLELDVALPNGELVRCSPNNEHADLFFGFPNSYGTLGYATRVRCRTIPTKPFVDLRHEKHNSFDTFLSALSKSIEDDVDFVDGVVFANDCIVLTTARLATSANEPSNYTDQEIYYRSLLTRNSDCLTIDDYIWRWDTDWFWCSKNVGAQNPLL